MEPVTEAVVIALVPGIVEVAKRAGLPARFAGLAAILAATAVIALSELAPGPANSRAIAGWLIRGIIAGLAAAGLYSQATKLGTRTVR